MQLFVCLFHKCPLRYMVSMETDVGGGTEESVLKTDLSPHSGSAILMVQLRYSLLDVFGLAK